MFQYEIFFTNEYLFELVNDICKIMKIKYDKSTLENAFQCSNNNSIENLFIVRDNNNCNLFICVDCNNKDWIFPLIVRCDSSTNELVNKCMLKWDNKIRGEYDQDLTVSIENSINNENTLLIKIEKFYGIKV